MPDDGRRLGVGVGLDGAARPRQDGPVSGSEGSRKAILAAFAANLGQKLQVAAEALESARLSAQVVRHLPLQARFRLVAGAADGLGHRRKE